VPSGAGGDGVSLLLFCVLCRGGLLEYDAEGWGQGVDSVKAVVPGWNQLAGKLLGRCFERCITGAGYFMLLTFGFSLNT